MFLKSVIYSLTSSCREVVSCFCIIFCSGQGHEFGRMQGAEMLVRELLFDYDEPAVNVKLCNIILFHGLVQG